MDEKEGYYLYTKDLTVGYNGKTLIEDIRLSLKKGKIMTLIGPNGAGKSTILKTIIRQLDCIKGLIYLNGDVYENYDGKEFAKKVSVVLTERTNTELWTCRDVVASGRYPYTGRMGILSKEDNEKVDEAMALVHGEELADKEFVHASDGQRQRILLARAVCQEPELIVLDEPTSFLDIRYKLELLQILQELVKTKKITVLMSLHELDLAQKISDIVVCVKGDKIYGYGTPEEIFKSDYINKLFDIKEGTYSAFLGTMEPFTVKIEPEVFVIAGLGSGITTYRKLLRDKTAFATGILHKNDIDYYVASSTGAAVICEEAFNNISDETYHKALSVMRKCSRVICCIKEFGEINGKNRMLLEEAEKLGILER